MEFVKVKYPRQRRVLLDGEDFDDTNKSFEVERGTHTFAVDEPTLEQQLSEFIELTSQQSPRILTFTPALGLTRGAMSPARIAAAKPVPPRKRRVAVAKKAPGKKAKPVGKRARSAKPVATKKAATKKRSPKKGSPKRGTPK